MTIKKIITSQAPDAKPVGVTKSISNAGWTILIEAPQYEIPEETFGGGTIVVPGVAEIISPLLISNISAGSTTVDIRIYRELDSNGDPDGTNYLIAAELPIPSYDILPIPLNGQFIATGDRLEITSNAASGINVTISYTVGQAEQDDVDGEVIEVNV
jgi:hypothetical protein